MKSDLISLLKKERNALSEQICAIDLLIEAAECSRTTASPTRVRKGSQRSKKQPYKRAVPSGKGKELIEVLVVGLRNSATPLTVKKLWTIGRKAFPGLTYYAVSKWLELATKQGKIKRVSRGTYTE